VVGRVRTVQIQDYSDNALMFQVIASDPESRELFRYQPVVASREGSLAPSVPASASPLQPAPTPLANGSVSPDTGSSWGFPWLTFGGAVVLWLALRKSEFGLAVQERLQDFMHRKAVRRQEYVEYVDLEPRGRSYQPPSF
jgi:hypothetical protein